MKTTNRRTIKATPCKLASGEWGADPRIDAEVGDTLLIRTRSGRCWYATVVAVDSRGRCTVERA